MELLYLLLLNFEDILQIVLDIVPIIFRMIFSMWQTWAFIGLIILLTIGQSVMQYFLIDKHEDFEND